MKEGHEKKDSLRLALCCLPALDMVLSPDVTAAFLILADNMHFYNVITLHYQLL